MSLFWYAEKSLQSKNVLKNKAKNGLICETMQDTNYLLKERFSIWEKF